MALTVENCDLVYSLVSKNAAFFTVPKEYFIRGTLQDEGFDPSLSLIAVHRDTGAIIAALVAVIRKGLVVGKNGFIKVIIVDKVYQRQGVGSFLLRELINRIKPMLPKFAMLRFGDSTPRYWHSGVDLRFTSLLFFLKKYGFKTGSFRQNLTCPLNNGDKEPKAEKNGYHLERVQAADYEAMVAFVKREFGLGAWPAETKMSLESTPPTTFVAKDATGQIIGFATHSAHFPGSFGPTGVLKSLRGKGLGGELLRWCVWDLKRVGLNSMEILWVVGNTVKFYCKTTGAYIDHVFRTMSRRL